MGRVAGMPWDGMGNSGCECFCYKGKEMGRLAGFCILVHVDLVEWKGAQREDEGRSGLERWTFWIWIEGLGSVISSIRRFDTQNLASALNRQEPPGVRVLGVRCLFNECMLKTCGVSLPPYLR